MLYEKLKRHAAGGIYPFHMPGHKRNPEFMPEGLPLDIDVTEIPGFDDLHDPKGIILELSELAAALYGAKSAFLLTTGSTAGILAAIGAHAKPGDIVLADSGCHRSIPNAAALFGLKLHYITPDADEASGVSCSVSPESVDEALQRCPDAKLVIITSPSYEGVVSDISGIAEVTRRSGALLFADCAHGAHLGFSGYFPESPVRLGADMAVVSLHKTLPALTQCSLLHSCSGRADEGRIKQMLYILQTSSPSYVLMASISHCLSLLKEKSKELFQNYENNLEYFKECTKKLRTQDASLSILTKHPGFFDIDPGKIVIITKNARMSGFELSDALRDRYHIECERACSNYVIAMTSICDPFDAYTLLADALLDISG